MPSPLAGSWPVRARRDVLPAVATDSSTAAAVTCAFPVADHKVEGDGPQQRAFVPYLAHAMRSVATVVVPTQALSPA
ncbi:hypothetical protein [Paenarthrobacter sp. FR1]|uniref:hypothetical protein n=1 Tax=Paenarthrobacter sp. FR1 TaxID=3439548 RepID=UPI003DA51DE6